MSHDERGTRRGVGSWALSLLASSFVAAGCAGHFSACPSAGGPPWRELSTGHFVLRTDLELDDARATLRDLELLRAALLTCFRARSDVDTGRIPVIAVRDGWGDFGPSDVTGIFTGALFRPLIILRAGGAVQRQETIKHELVHFFSRRVTRVQPYWFAEGLATYYQTVEYDLEKHQVVVGRPPDDLLRFVQRAALLSTGDMRAAKDTGEDQRARAFFYPTAWFMMHFLMNSRPAGIVAYSAAIQRSPEREAWAGSFPDLPGKELDWALRRYLDGGQYSLLIFPFNPPEPRIAQERTLTDADVHATRALLLALAAGRPRDPERSESPDELRAHARREIDEALRQEPAHLLGHAVRYWELHAGTTPPEARLVAEANPADWMAWLLLAEALREAQITEGSVAAAEKAADLASEDPAVTLKVSIHRSALGPPPP